MRTFELIPTDQVKKRLALIASFEGVEVDLTQLESWKKHKGDLRNSIAHYEEAAYLDVNFFVSSWSLESSGFDAKQVRLAT